MATGINILYGASKVQVRLLRRFDQKEKGLFGKWQQPRESASGVLFLKWHSKVVCNCTFDEV